MAGFFDDQYRVDESQDRYGSVSDRQFVAADRDEFIGGAVAVSTVEMNARRDAAEWAANVVNDPELNRSGRSFDELAAVEYGRLMSNRTLVREVSPAFDEWPEAA